jgi:aminoglycoside N3'-acetyltransferase
MSPTRSVAQLASDLRSLGVVEGEVVMVHASLRKLGAVEGRAAGVLAALEQAVGSEGTLMMTVGARDDWAWVNERPEAERVALLAEAEPFDAAVTPAESDMGVLAEVFRQQPGTLVTDHPEGRFAARGRLAAALVADAPWNDYYGPGSALERLVSAGGKVLRLGADIDTVTLIHHAEFLAQVPNRRRVVRYRKVLRAGRSEIVRVETLDDCDGIVGWQGPDYFGLILQEYLVLGRARQGVVGNAPSELLDAADLVSFASAWMTQHLGR